METLKKESLVIYKGQPALVVEYGKKIDIKLADGNSKKVRDKDILLIHPGPVKSLKFSDLECDIDEIWNLLQGEEVTLLEFSEFLYGEDSPEAVYNGYKLLKEGLYFSGNIDLITCTSADFIKDELEKVSLKKEKELRYAESMNRLLNGEWSSEDEVPLREIEGLALEQRIGSKVLKVLGVKETSVDAHRFLIKIGYWNFWQNPHPGRMGISLKSSVKITEYDSVINSLNLTHMKSYAIDDEGSRDPDDAISIDGDKVWIHITDVASIIKPGSPEDLDASARGSNLYLPTETVHMLPTEVTEIQALGSPEGNNTISFMIQFDEEFNVIKREIHLARVNVERLTYHQVEDERDSNRFKPFYSIAEKLKCRRVEAGALSISLPEVKIRVDESNEISIIPINGIESRNVVSEFMLLAGECAALFCQENSIPIPYATQQSPDAKGVPESDLASMFVWRRKFKRGETKYSPAPHAGLGLNCYTRATSPLRRYSDLVVNQQIRRYLMNEPLMEEDDILIKVAPALDSMRKLTMCERVSNLHWKLIYLKKNINLIYIGTYVEKKDKGMGLLLIEDLAFEAIVPMAELPELNEKINIKIKKIDIPTATVTFTVC